MGRGQYRMKNLMKVLLLSFLVISTCYAAPRGNGNAITLLNNSDKDILYTMRTFSFDNIYDIRRGGSDTYHSKNADEYVTVEIAEWTPAPGDKYAHKEFHNCVNLVHYNADLIKTIRINSINSCTVTCLDGGTTSCRQTG